MIWEPYFSCDLQQRVKIRIGSLQGNFFVFISQNYTDGYRNNATSNFYCAEKRGHGVDELVATMVVLVTTVEL